MILKGLSTVQYNGQMGRDSAPVRSGNTGQDSSGFEQWERDQREIFESEGEGRREA